MEHKIPSLLQIKLGWKTNGLADSVITNLEGPPEEEGKAPRVIGPMAWMGKKGEIPCSQDLR